MRFIIVFLLAIAAGTVGASAAGSSFQRSCWNIGLDVQEYSVWLQADCNDNAGGSVFAEIELHGIYNHLGDLMIGNDYGSSFQRSCRTAWLEVEDYSVRLVAICNNNRGGERQTGIYINGIHNQYGVLVHD